jgi:hypothetical protein
MRTHKFKAPVLIVLVAAAGMWALICAISPAERLREQHSLPVFTPAHQSAFDAVKEFLGWRPAPVQPIAFPHKTHLAKGMQCTDCHASAEKAAVAGLPSTQLCMTCHQVIATDRPEIKKVLAFFARGEDIPWQRVYAYYPSAHVKFNHAPHIRAAVECKTCHGALTQQTVAVRAVKLTMGYCLDCHRQKKASIDCVTCHY